MIRETVRTVDFAARYGGEEFAVIVPEIDLASLSAIAERIRTRMGDRASRHYLSVLRVGQRAE